jgi:protein-L-isoaspartate(D-aspartate) O-methyltransferase
LIGHIVSKGLEPDVPLVVSVERDENLAQFATKNIERIGLSRVIRVVSGDGSLGYPQESEEELYDRIIVTAGAPRIPLYLKKQLKKDGILEVPVGGRTFQKLVKLKKREGKPGKEEFEETRLVDCMFVPLIGADANQS